LARFAGLAVGIAASQEKRKQPVAEGLRCHPSPMMPRRQRILVLATEGLHNASKRK